MSNEPRFSTRLWSEEVALAEASSAAPADAGYSFSSGRTFAAPRYDAPLPSLVGEVATQRMASMAAPQVVALAGVGIDVTVASAQAQAHAGQLVGLSEGDTVVATAQAQGAQAAARLALDSAASTAQGQRSLAVDGARVMGLVTTRQAQTSSAQAGTASLAGTVSTAQGQTVAATVARSLSLAHFSRQAQRSSASASAINGGRITTRQAQSARAQDGASATLDYYVDAVNGLDTNAGTLESPWQTLAKAQSSLATASGTTTVVHLAPGTYDAASGHSFTRSGASSTARIQYTSTVKHGAVLTAGSGSRWVCQGSARFIDFIDVACTGPLNHGGFYFSRGDVHWIGCHIHDLATGVTNVESGGGGIISSDAQSATSPAVTGYLIDGCWIHHTGQAGNPWYHGIYDQGYGTIVRNCIIYKPSYGGIHWWHDASHGVAYNNTIIACGAGVIVGNGGARFLPDFADAAEFYVANNILVDCGMPIYEDLRSDDTASQTQLTNRGGYWNNITYQSNYNISPNEGPHKPSGTFSNNRTLNPQFVGYVPGSLDFSRGPDGFRLQATSPAVAAGSTAYVPALDYAGTARPVGAAPDIGALQR